MYCFRAHVPAEKSKTRRHLTEVLDGGTGGRFPRASRARGLAEEFVVSIVGRALDRCAEDLKRPRARHDDDLFKVQGPFPRITYRQAIEKLAAKGMPVKFGDDLGADEETEISKEFDRPVMITRYPAAIKSFYMQPDPEDPEVVLGLDMIAPEGYGEIIGGSQRIHDHDLLLQRIRDNNLPVEAYQWYLDVRKYGTFPHSGFGMGLERTVAWICGIHHLREAIPYPHTEPDLSMKGRGDTSSDTGADRLVSPSDVRCQYASGRPKSSAHDLARVWPRPRGFPVQDVPKDSASVETNLAV